MEKQEVSFWEQITQWLSAPGYGGWALILLGLIVLIVNRRKIAGLFVGHSVGKAFWPTVGTLAVFGLINGLLYFYKNGQIWSQFNGWAFAWLELCLATFIAIGVFSDYTHPKSKTAKGVVLLLLITCIWVIRDVLTTSQAYAKMEAEASSGPGTIVPYPLSLEANGVHLNLPCKNMRGEVMKIRLNYPVGTLTRIVNTDTALVETYINESGQKESVVGNSVHDAMNLRTQQISGDFNITIIPDESTLKKVVIVKYGREIDFR